jgi:hypothetical protein
MHHIDVSSRNIRFNLAERVVRETKPLPGENKNPASGAEGAS